MCRIHVVTMAARKQATRMAMFHAFHADLSRAGAASAISGAFHVFHALRT